MTDRRVPRRPRSTTAHHRDLAARSDARPDVQRIYELGDDRVALWLEDIACTDTPRDRSRFLRAARLLGRWAGRRFGGEAGGRCGCSPRDAWRPRRSPGCARAPSGPWPPGFRGILDRLDALQQASGHGDACPQNLLVPRARPEEFVVIDVGWQCPHPVGADVTQLLVGLAHAGQLAVRELPSLRRALLAAYATGLRDEGHPVDHADIALGCDGTLAVRSAFHAHPELARYLVGLGCAL